MFKNKHYEMMYFLNVLLCYQISIKSESSPKDISKKAKSRYKINWTILTIMKIETLSIKLEEDKRAINNHI